MNKINRRYKENTENKSWHPYWMTSQQFKGYVKRFDEMKTCRVDF
jgi:hypothetical protein